MKRNSTKNKTRLTKNVTIKVVCLHYSKENKFLHSGIYDFPRVPCSFELIVDGKKKWWRVEKVIFGIGATKASLILKPARLHYEK